LSEKRIAYDSALSEQKVAYDTALSELKTAHETCLSERNEFAKELDTTRLTVSKLEAQLASTRHSLAEQTEAKSSLDTDLSALKVQLETAKTKIREYEAKLGQLEAINKQIGVKSGEVEAVRSSIKELEAKLAEAASSHETARQAWCAEKVKLAAQKDEELQRNIEGLEKRFVEDYATFMQTHKEAIQRTLSEKSGEFAREKEKLMEMYERKLGEHEAAEARLRKQVKEAEQRRRGQVEAGVQTEVMEEKKCESGGGGGGGDDERVEELLERIGGLEELIGGADAHFEQEIERLKGEMEEEFRAKLEEEMEKEAIRRGELVRVIEELKRQMGGTEGEIFFVFSSQKQPFGVCVSGMYIFFKFFKNICNFTTYNL